MPEAGRGTGEAGACDQDATEEVRVVLDREDRTQRWQGVVDATYRVSGIRDAAWTAITLLMSTFSTRYSCLARLCHFLR